MEGYYVYIHRTKDTDQVFYVGKGHDRRAWESVGRNRYWNHVANKHGFVVELLEEGLSEYEAYDAEQRYIKHYGRFQNGGLLVNLTDGGEGRKGFSWNGQRSGTSNPMFGRKQSEEARQKIAQSKVGKPRPLEVVEGMRERGRNRPKEAHGMYGRKHTVESKQKMSIAAKGKRKPLSVILNQETGLFYFGWIEVAELLNKKITQLEYLRSKNKLNNFIVI